MIFVLTMKLCCCFKYMYIWWSFFMNISDFTFFFFHWTTNSPPYWEYQSDLFSRLEKAIGSLFYISIYSRVKFIAATTIESYVSRRVVAVLFVFGWSFLVATALVLTCRPLLAEGPGHDFWMSILLTSGSGMYGSSQYSSPCVMLTISGVFNI